MTNIPQQDKKIGYHVVEIQKGILGEISKIQEELDELSDAMNQDCKVMALIELADMLGAMDAFLKTHFSGFNINDLIKMSNITKRAFENGLRT